MHDEAALNKELNKVMTQVFKGKNSAFLGSLMCAHNFQWDYDGSVTQTACTDGLTITWNVQDFLRCSPLERHATLLHELWHTGMLHFAREGVRDPELWNIACDYRINNDLLYEGIQIPNNGYWIFDLQLDTTRQGFKPMPEEEIYDLLKSKKLKKPKTPMADMKGMPFPSSGSGKSGAGGQTPGAVKQAHITAQIQAVVRAFQSAKMAHQAGSLPGHLVQVLKDFLEPKIDWKPVLYRWMTDLMPTDEYTWKRPNRRYPYMYMPSRDQEFNRLDHLAYIQDTSGSISEEDMKVFNSEVKYVKETLEPRKLTLVQFDTKIQYVKEFGEDDTFENIEIHGGGGTSLVPVRKWIEENNPKAAIIFSDLWCDPMRPLSRPIPLIWVAVNNKEATVPFGELIRLTY